MKRQVNLSHWSKKGDLLSLCDLIRFIKPGHAVTKYRILAVFGTRPEAIKMAPVVRELGTHEAFQCQVAVSGQHREMLQAVLEQFAVPVHFNLDIMRESQTLFDITARVLRGLEEVLEESRPHLVLVHGDTTTTFAGALAAFYRQVPVGHVEAGLRSHRKDAPFPEEMNRCLTGVLADVHLAPTAAARGNLRREGVRDDDIQVTGNTAIDALLMTVQEDYTFSRPELQQLDFSRPVLVLETHRRENWGEPMEAICRGVTRVLERFPGVQVVFPVHPNPVVSRVVEKELGHRNQVLLVSPLGYPDFAHLMARSYLILTDSGGIQEEAPSLGKPVLVLREVTERPEAVAAGTVQLVGTAEENVAGSLARLLQDEEAYQAMARAINPYGDGQAAWRIGQGLLHYFGLRTEPGPQFVPVRPGGNRSS